MLMLTSPYGHPEGIGIHLKCKPTKKINDPRLLTIFLKYSCHPKYTEKAINCLRNSQRYDCRLQDTWFVRQYEEVIEDFKKFDIELTVQAEDQKYFEKRIIERNRWR